MTKSTEVANRTEAWKAVNELFPTDYIEDAHSSQNAGYPIYVSTLKECYDWISDLGTTLEVNIYATGDTFRFYWTETETAKETETVKNTAIEELNDTDRAVYELQQRMTQPAYFGKVITEEGYYSTPNMSAIYSFLIQQCGRFVERFSSDLIIGINVLEDRLQEMNTIIHGYYNPELCNIFPVTEYFGLRQDGVDHWGFIQSRIENRDRYAYRHIYRVEVKVCEGTVFAKLEEVEIHH